MRILGHGILKFRDIRHLLQPFLFEDADNLDMGRGHQTPAWQQCREAEEGHMCKENEKLKFVEEADIVRGLGIRPHAHDR